MQGVFLVCLRVCISHLLVNFLLIDYINIIIIDKHIFIWHRRRKHLHKCDTNIWPYKTGLVPCILLSRNQRLDTVLMNQPSTSEQEMVLNQLYNVDGSLVLCCQ